MCTEPLCETTVFFYSFGFFFHFTFAPLNEHTTTVFRRIIFQSITRRGSAITREEEEEAEKKNIERTKK